jgi:methionyl-tRNA formyltransferase
MALVREMDAGPIYFHEKAKLHGDETKPELCKKFATRGAQLMLEKLPEIISGQLSPTAQDDAAATYTKLLTKADGLLDPTTMTAKECERKVRAYLGWPKTRLTFLGRDIIVTKARVVKYEAETAVPCVDGQWLEILELVAPSGKTMATADYLNGLK